MYSLVDSLYLSQTEYFCEKELQISQKSLSLMLTSTCHQTYRWAHILSFTSWIWSYFLGGQSKRKITERSRTDRLGSWNSMYLRLQLTWVSDSCATTVWLVFCCPPTAAFGLWVACNSRSAELAKSGRPIVDFLMWPVLLDFVNFWQRTKWRFTLKSVVMPVV